MPHNNNSETAVIVDTNPVVAPGILSAFWAFEIKKNPHEFINIIWISFVSGYTDCSICRCEAIVEQSRETCDIPCKPCNQPCTCEQSPCNGCVEECCEHPSGSGPIEIITTVEIVETCAMYDQVIVNDEPQSIETNHTITSFYQISESDLIKQKQEIESFQNGIHSNQRRLCGNGGGLFGIRGDEEQTQFNDTSQEFPSNVSNSINNRNVNQAKGSVVANLVNFNNNRPIKTCQIVSGWTCQKFGRYPHPTNCQKVYID